MLDPVVFEQFANDCSIVNETQQRSNYCPECPDTPMLIHSNEYQCPLCKRTESANITSVDAGMNPNSLSRHRTAADNSRAQRETLLRQMRQCCEEYKGQHFSSEIIDAVIDKYHSIQGLTKSVMQGDKEVKKKIVHRSNVKNEILATILFNECLRRGDVRKRRDVAEFLQLSNGGFSNGEGILRQLQIENDIDVISDEDPTRGFAERYLKALGKANAKYVDFIVELIEHADKLRHGTSSLPSSKVAGSIWLLNNSLKLNITVEEMEQAADKTKKNTFIKFYNVVLKNKQAFRVIFQKHRIRFPVS